MGGLMQLVAYGAQDIYLTGNPQITYFKAVYRRHTNFSMEDIKQTFTGSVDFGKNPSATVSRNGDLITSSYLRVTLPALSKENWKLHKEPPSPSSPSSPSCSPTPSSDDLELCWTNYVGLALINHVDLHIGGQKIDRHYGEWMFAWQELTMTSEKLNGYKKMVGGTDQNGYLCLDNATSEQVLYIPLMFWFNLNPGLALPLIALQYHEVKIEFHFKDFNQLVVLVNKKTGDIVPRSEYHPHKAGATLDAELYLTYTYLDTDERRRFAQMSHEYLITQVQHFQHGVGLSKGSQNVNLNFNHPVKQIIFTLQRDAMRSENDWFNYSNSAIGHEKEGSDILQSVSLHLNGHERWSPKRDALYFRLVQPFYHCTSIPSSCIYTYSFGLRPEEHQPSGTCNFSRIDNTKFHLEVDDHTSITSPADPSNKIELPGPQHAQLNVWAMNYNVLRIMSGMGGLAYSN